MLEAYLSKTNIETVKKKETIKLIWICLCDPSSKRIIKINFILCESLKMLRKHIEFAKFKLANANTNLDHFGSLLQVSHFGLLYIISSNFPELDRKSD